MCANSSLMVDQHVNCKDNLYAHVAVEATVIDVLSGWWALEVIRE